MAIRIVAAIVTVLVSAPLTFAQAPAAQPPPPQTLPMFGDAAFQRGVQALQTPNVVAALQSL